MSKNETKQFSLAPIDSNLLIYTRQHLDAIFSGILSTMAMTKLGYTVTDKTKFELSDDFATIKISEVNDEPTEPAIKAAKEKA